MARGRGAAADDRDRALASLTARAYAAGIQKCYGTIGTISGSPAVTSTSPARPLDTGQGPRSIAPMTTVPPACQTSENPRGR
jgi:hypothetical protein